MAERMASHNGASVLSERRRRMLDLLAQHVRDQRVVEAMARVPRERFVPEELQYRAYDDSALPIGEGQTISQPLIVALMVEALRPSPSDRALEIGTGSGYAAAVLSRLVREVVTVERIPRLADEAQAVLAALGIDNVRVHIAGEHLGRKEEAAYDAILISAGAPHVPRPLLDQLAEGGRLVAPIGSRHSQQLIRVVKSAEGLTLDRLGACAFVPLIGEGAWREDDGNGVSRRANVR
jgi:protein-L-isoaspartate(D-aspartate) O-methyltransferase